MFDTGSSNSWVLAIESAEKMPNDRKILHNFYNKKLSETYVEPEDKVFTKISFGEGHLKGF